MARSSPRRTTSGSLQGTWHGEGAAVRGGLAPAGTQPNSAGPAHSSCTSHPAKPAAAAAAGAAGASRPTGERVEEWHIVACDGGQHQRLVLPRFGHPARGARQAERLRSAQQVGPARCAGGSSAGRPSGAVHCTRASTAALVRRQQRAALTPAGRRTACAAGRWSRRGPPGVCGCTWRERSSRNLNHQPRTKCCPAGIGGGKQGSRRGSLPRRAGARLPSPTAVARPVCVASPRAGGT